MRAPAKKQGRKTAASILLARLNERVTLESRADGGLAARFDGYQVALGKLGPGASSQAKALRSGLPFAAFASARSAAAQELDVLVRRLARNGLIEYRLVSPQAKDIVVIEPQLADYWPQAASLRATEVIAMSRFAYLRRRGQDIILESPRAPALFRICDEGLAAFLAKLARPQKIGVLRQQRGFPGAELIGLLLGCGLLFKPEGKSEGLRAGEGDDSVVVWDFHDLLFHARSTEGRHADPLGGRYPYVGMIAPPPAIRAAWQGNAIDLQPFARPPEAASPFVKLLRERHSTRDFDDARPIDLAELARFLDSAARVQWKWTDALDLGDGPTGPDIDYTRRPYPSAGSACELELYLTVANCEGLQRGFYHYDADRHVLVPIATRSQEIEAQLAAAQFAMGAEAFPQILFTIAARFGRVSWKYSAIAYSLILKDVGVLLQTLYLVATDMGLGGCAIGTSNIDLFARMTGQEFHREGPVGQFALGRAAKVGEAI